MAHSATVRTAEVMRTVVSGRASRLVRRKWRGKLWKRHQASGPVNSWQLMLRAAAFQMRRKGSQAGDGGYQASSDGYTRKMPAMAR